MTLQAMLGTYIIIQLYANTMGLTVLFVLDSVISRCLRDRGYTDLPTTASDKIRKFGKGTLKFFIPFYYCLKGINLVCENGSFESVVDSKIKNGEVIPIIRKQKKVTQTVETPQINIEPLAMTESYKAVPNGKSLYAGKREITPKFEGEIIKPEDTLVTPFAKKENNTLRNDKTKEDELFEYLNSRDSKELSEIMKSIRALEEAKSNEPIDAFRLTLEDKKVA